VNEPDLYFSVDVESDGPIPGIYSMLSFGLVVAGRFDGKQFERSDAEPQSFYRELKPLSDEFVPEAVAVTGLDRDELTRVGVAPAHAMEGAKAWVEELAVGHHPVLVGFPLVFDWMFLYWYFVRFTKGSPFSHSSGLDMKSIYQAKARVRLSDAGKDDLPSALRSSIPHTHNALDDAMEQAEIFAKLFEWRPGA
jgi:hypothetical protein